LNQSRLSRLQKWLCHYFKVDSITLTPLTGDAGFRVYYRFTVNGISYLAVDAIPDKSNNLAFVEIQKVLQQKNINVPDIITYDLELGFLCISDLGETLFSDFVTLSNMNESYQKAINLLPSIASISLPKHYTLPNYDAEFIHVECNIFTEWLLSKHLNIALNEQEITQLHECFLLLIDSALDQPQVFMHRDFHSRNLMLIDSHQKSQDNNLQLGVIDFQDAVVGPITYDVVSLLRDCYVKWPDENVNNLFQYFCQLINVDNKYTDVSQEQWQRWFDLMGLQRHIKASGIFARLFHRDNKTGYLKDIPLTLSYIVDISAKYKELSFLHDLVLHKVIPSLTAKEMSQKDIEGID